MVIDIQGVARDKALRARAVRLVGAALEPIKLAPVRAKITFFDDNGPKGGLGMRCAVDVRLPFRPSIRVEQVAETSRIAFDGAFAALERRLERYRQRDRDIKRRPKKYFVAKRLLTGGLEPSAKPKRVRRRKEA
ncbi:MAG TPA: HPF/RaiA family ribosome-associated protein [Methylomirabilota bacterium]